MVVSCHHVLGPQIIKRHQINAGDFLNVTLVTLGNGVGERWLGKQKQSRAQQSDELQKRVSRPGLFAWRRTSRCVHENPVHSERALPSKERGAKHARIESRCMAVRRTREISMLLVILLQCIDS